MTPTGITKMNFGNISLPVFPKGSSLKFRNLSYVDSIDEAQQVILDSLWNARDN